MPTDNVSAWDSYSAAYQASTDLSTDVAEYGPDLPTEAELRLLGDLRGKRVLELGCGGGHASIAFAKQGATTIAVDHSAEQLAHARRLAEETEVKVEFRQGDLADLAFLRADSIDLAFSADAFGYVDDLNRVFRQVHRILRVGAPLVFSLPHPAYSMIDDSADPPTVQRSYFDHSPFERAAGAVHFTLHHHTIEDLYTGLLRASYRVDALLEPEPLGGGPRSSLWRPAMQLVPRALIVRARKEGN